MIAGRPSRIALRHTSIRTGPAGDNSGSGCRTFVLGTQEVDPPGNEWADYEGIAGEAAAAALSKKIDKETLATLHYRYECMELRLAPKEDTFF